jgi:hypothetical protein
MAKRPVYVPETEGASFVSEHLIEFDWHAGFSVSQKQRSIQSLHENAIQKLRLNSILEISSKSPIEEGQKLSAFSLPLKLAGTNFGTVETAFQGSKVFAGGGPYRDLYLTTSREAKRDPRVRRGDALLQFDLMGEVWDLEPTTLFYDWLYINAVSQQSELAFLLKNYDGFTDIEFNPKKSLNCQARAAALFKSLFDRGQLKDALSSAEKYKTLMNERLASPHPVQGILPL